MSELAKSARAAMKAKAQRMAGPGDDKSKSIDASGWREPTDMNATAKTGMRPVSRRQFKSGGAVSGERTASRADRKGRKNPPEVNAKVNRNVREANHQIAQPHIGGFADGGATNFRKQMHGMMGVGENLHGRRNGVGKFHRSHKAGGGGLADILAADARAPRKTEMPTIAVSERPNTTYSAPDMGGGGNNGEAGGNMRRGGRSHKDGGGGILDVLTPVLAGAGALGAKKALGMKKGGRSHKAKGGSVEGADYTAGMRPKGDRIPRAMGGKTKGKGKTQIIIGIHAGGAHNAPPQGGPIMPPKPPMAPPAAPPAMPPSGAPPMAGGPPGMMPPGMGMPPMGRKSGGKVVGARYGDASIAKAEKVKTPKGIPGGGAGGLGRLAKASIARKEGFRPV